MLILFTLININIQIQVLCKAPHFGGFFILLKLGDYMKIIDHLSSEELQHMKNLKNKDKSNNNTSNERLSDRDLAELMGTNRTTYRRVRGAIKRK